MTTYRVAAHREGRFWVGVIEGVGATQARSLASLSAMATDLVVVMTKETDGDFTIEIDAIDVPAAVERKVAAARKRTERAAREQGEAGRASREAASALRHAGLTTQDAAFVMGVTPQRVSQLLSRPA